MYILLIMIAPLLLEFFIIWKREREKESDYVVILPKGYCKIIMRCTIACILLAIMIYLRFGIEASREVIIFLLCMCFLFVLICSIFTRGEIKIEEEKIIVVPLLRNKQDFDIIDKLGTVGRNNTVYCQDNRAFRQYGMKMGR